MRNKISGIYKIVNLINNKLYIGSAAYLMQRKADHFFLLRKGIHYSLHLQKAWNKYGADAFEFIILEECKKEKLLEREQIWINLTECYKPHKGYNLRQKAESNFGIKASEETKRRQSTASKGRIISKEHRLKISKTLTGYKHTEEYKRNMSVIVKKRGTNYQRNVNKWPHKDGSRCICEDCIKQTRLMKAATARKRYNKLHGITIVNEFIVNEAS